MANYTQRGNSHNVVFGYKNEQGQYKQHWETYQTEIDAMLRKVHIDNLQKNKLYHELLKEVQEYKAKQAALNEIAADLDDSKKSEGDDTENRNKTYGEFVEKWLPIHVRKKRCSPGTYDNYVSNLNHHILPFFGDKVMSSITAEDIDCFLDYLSQKPIIRCERMKKDNPKYKTLSSGTIHKCFSTFMAGFPAAKKWKYIDSIPEATPPKVISKKRRAWEPKGIFEILETVEDEMLHLAIHIAFVCSLRAGEVAGIKVNSLNISDGSITIAQTLQRVTDDAITKIPAGDLFYVFPKKSESNTTTLVAKRPKNFRSDRTIYIANSLTEEIISRLKRIQEQKHLLGKEYNDYGLLFCEYNGDPLDPKAFNKQFKASQYQAGIGPENIIEFQGLRKSGQMHKVRVSGNDFQLVAENSGQSPKVLMSNYNEALESEKRNLAFLVEQDLEKMYKPTSPPASEQAISEDMSMPKKAEEVDENVAMVKVLAEALNSNPNFALQIQQLVRQMR